MTEAFIQPEAQPSVTQMLTHSALYFPGNLMQRHDAVIGYMLDSESAWLLCKEDRVFIFRV